MTNKEKIVDWQKRAVIYFKENMPVHIVTNSDQWANGYIKEIYDDYLVVYDRVNGRMAIFYADMRIFSLFTGPIDSLKPVKKEGVSE